MNISVLYIQYVYNFIFIRAKQYFILFYQKHTLLTCLLLHRDCLNYIYVFAGLGFKINFPLSSQDMLKSLSTDRVLAVIILGAITFLCTPIMNSNTGSKREQTNILRKQINLNDSNLSVGSIILMQFQTFQKFQCFKNIFPLSCKFFLNFKGGERSKDHRVWY